MNYVRGFDGVRAIAVLMVMAHHKLYMVIPDSWHLGKTGANLFFCVSGFLIFGILGERKTLCEAGRSSVPEEIKRFYTRRFLRLSPPYFGYLFVALAMALLFPDDFQYSGFIYHFTYTTNFWIGFVEKTWSNIFGHFWSLAVEEQFYLIAAPLLLLVPRKNHLMIMVGFLLLGATSYAALAVGGADNIVIYVFPTISFALICFGGSLGLSKLDFSRRSLVFDHVQYRGSKI